MYNFRLYRVAIKNVEKWNSVRPANDIYLVQFRTRLSFMEISFLQVDRRVALGGGGVLKH